MTSVAFKNVVNNEHAPFKISIANAHMYIHIQILHFLMLLGDLLSEKEKKHLPINLITAIINYLLFKHLNTYNN